MAGLMTDTIKHLLGSAGPSGFGSKSTAEQVTNSDLQHITAIITGGTSGIGEETARVLAMKGARVVIPGRNLKAAEEVKCRILKEFQEAQVVVMHLDLSSLTSVRKFVDDFESLNLPLNLLINNAGMYCNKHAISEDGVEMKFATNYLGHFLLTKLLMKKMIDTAEKTGVEGRIVNVVSNIFTWWWYPIAVDDDHLFDHLNLISGAKNYIATSAYALSKLAMVLHTQQLARRLKEMKVNVTANSLHPGIVRTKISKDRGLIIDLIFLLTSKLLKTIPQGAATTCYVATHPKLQGVSGKFFVDCNEAVISTTKNRTKSHLDLEHRLWAASNQFIHQNMEKYT